MGRKTVVYYPDARGQMPALDFLRALDRDERQKASAYLSYLEEHGEGLRRPIAEYLARSCTNCGQSRSASSTPSWHGVRGGPPCLS